jgi:hypothetical protein
MPMIIERDLANLVLPISASELKDNSGLQSFTLVSGPETRFQGFEWKIEFPLTNAYRILVTGPERPRPPHDNLNAPSHFKTFKLVKLDRDECSAVFDFPESDESNTSLSGLTEERLQLKLRWKYMVYSEVIRIEQDKTQE